MTEMESLTDEQRALFATGGQLDDYEVLKPIGKGKFSVVYKAKRRHDDQAVALKKIAIFDMMNVKAREKTLKEVRLVQSVKHPNIIQYLDAFVQNNELYIAFEWAEAGDLKRQVRKANEKGVRFDERTIWRYFTQLCGAILYLHENRIMHRDLKPANIFLTLKGVVKVGDLGLGRYLSENTMEARSKVGTPLYMSPEVLRGESYDWKSDVWSMGCILYELAMLRSPFKSEGLNLVGLFQKINKGYYEPITNVYSDHLRTLAKQMISLTSSDRPTAQEVWEFCRTRPSSAALQERMRQHQAATENNNDAANNDPESRSSRLRRTRSKLTPEKDDPSRPSSAEHQQETPPQSRPPSSQGDTSTAQAEEIVRKRHAEARMELLFERLKILRYEKVLNKRISPTHFACEGRALPRISSQARFEDMCSLSYWLISLLDGEAMRNDAHNNDPPIVSAQKILLAAEKAGVSVVAQLSAPALTSGVGIEVCELLDALTTAVLSGEDYCTTPPEYPKDPVETLECDALDVTDDDGKQNESSDKFGESTSSVVLEDDDTFSRWIVVKEEALDDKVNDMIHTDIDPVAWELERRRMLPKLQAALLNKLQRRPADSSWRVRLDQMQTQAGSIVEQESMQNEVAKIQATRQKQVEQLEVYEKQLNTRYIRARRLYDEGRTRLTKCRDEMLIAQENVNQATVEIARLQAAKSEQANALKAADARITDNSRLFERKRQLRLLVDENRELVLSCSMSPRTTQSPNSYHYEAESDCEYDDTGLGLEMLEQAEPFLTFESIQFDAKSRLATFQFHFCGGRRFQATMSLAGELQDIDETSPVVRNALLHIGLCVLPWFWMGYNCKYIRIQAGYLDPEQVHFWEEFYQNVLSEYLYLHGLDRDRLHIIMDAPATGALQVLSNRKLEPKVLVPLGGGKDSLVVYQLLSSSDTPCAWLHVGDRPQEFDRNWRFKEIVDMTQNRTKISAFRFEHNMDDKTWESEVAGTRYQPAGHPWAALVAFDSVLAAILGCFTHVAVGNERSANYGNNVVHEGRPVNHQYDKSFDFETRAHAYIRKYLVEDLHYFSALQHLWEVQIARTFASRSLDSSENFLPVFLSCNEAPDGDKWCCKCAKCAFVFILMSAWCSEAQLVEIFGENLFEKETIFPEFLSLLDEEGVKPMECVGTACETWLSLYLALQTHGHTTFLKTHTIEIHQKGGKLMHLLEDYNNEHLLPEFLEPALRQPVMMGA
ncbi:Serine/threonine-protein kinase Nek6 [Phytophthora citrophthora]|uniref:non-specific serine/threonine protein kinase n=1 Tax=Phytophthora citrophthora TaxID=4793 RepID=A0AAD9LRZ6_9STRA|nr:Serine/threonine-protein kinase Nek6 [Phytophthora citrophthora]